MEKEMEKRVRRLVERKKRYEWEQVMEKRVRRLV
jgi:hypothetical protein